MGSHFRSSFPGRKFTQRWEERQQRHKNSPANRWNDTSTGVPAPGTATRFFLPLQKGSQVLSSQLERRAGMWVQGCHRRDRMEPAWPENLSCPGKIFRAVNSSLGRVLAVWEPHSVWNSCPCCADSRAKAALGVLLSIPIPDKTSPGTTCPETAPACRPTC